MIGVKLRMGYSIILLMQENKRLRGRLHFFTRAYEQKTYKHGESIRVCEELGVFMGRADKCLGPARLLHYKP